MKILILILAILPLFAKAQITPDSLATPNQTWDHSTPNSLVGCYAGTFMYREKPSTVWTTVRPDTLIVFDADSVTFVNYYGDTVTSNYVSWLLVKPNTINPTTSHTYIENDFSFCTLGLGFDECNYSTIEEIQQTLCSGIKLVFTNNDSIHYLVECFQPGQLENIRWAWFKGKKYTSIIPDSLQNVSVPKIEKNKIIVNIYPNPVKDILNIKLSKKEKVTITINDITGKQIYKSNFYSQNIPISFKRYKKGLYFVTIINKNSTITKKIVYL